MREKFEVVTVREDEKLPDDRRRSPRASCEYTAEFVDPATGFTVRGTVRDISQVGMRVHTMGPVRLREPDDLKFYLWINGSLLKLSGSVVRQGLDGNLGVEFKAAGESLRDRLAHHVSEAAHRNLKLEMRSRFIDDVPLPPQPTVRTVARMFMRGHNTIHDGMSAAKSLQQSIGKKWIDRRVATHLNDG